MIWKEKMKNKLEIISYKNDLLLYWLFQKKHIKPYQLGLITFLFGFGIMSIWYWLLVFENSPYARLKGLYGYYSSAIGDSIILPLLSFLIAKFYIMQEKLFSYASIEVRTRTSALFSKKVWIVSAFIIAGLTVFFFHIFALYGANRNWTLPEYGVLNAPGWYHGAFMFFQVYLIAGYCIKQIVAIFLMLKYSDKLNFPNTYYLISIKIVFGILILMGIFGGLLASDRINSFEKMLPSPFGILINEASIVAYYLFGVPISIILLLTAKRFGLVFNYFYNIVTLLFVIGIPIITFFLFYKLNI